MGEPYPNKFGRKGGRGIRPWLLVPKIFGIVVYVGGFCAVLAVWRSSDFTSLAMEDPRRALVLHQISQLLVFLIVPAATTAIVFGVLLLLQHPAVFLRLRWMQVKLIALLIVIPSCHFYARAQYTHLKMTADKQISDAAAGRFELAIIAAIAGSAVVIILGRIKPRLGQNPALKPDLARR
jgi:uncharacterized membrane protein